MAVEPREVKSVPDLIVDVVRETRELLRTEGDLVRAEISDKITQLEVGGGSIAAGAMCLLVALFVLSQALIVAIGHVIDDAYAALIVGVVLALIGLALLLKGRRNLKPSNLTPDRSARQLREDTRLVKEQTR